MKNLWGDVVINNEVQKGEICLTFFGVQTREQDGSFRAFGAVMSDLIDRLIELKKSESDNQYQMKKQYIFSELLGPRYKYELWDIDDIASDKSTGAPVVADGSPIGFVKRSDGKIANVILWGRYLNFETNADGSLAAIEITQ